MDILDKTPRMTKEVCHQSKEQLAKSSRELAIKCQQLVAAFSTASYLTIFTCFRLFFQCFSQTLNVAVTVDNTNTSCFVFCRVTSVFERPCLSWPPGCDAGANGSITAPSASRD